MAGSPVPVRRSRRLANSTPVNYDVSSSSIEDMNNSDNEPWDSEDEEEEEVVAEEPSTAASMCVAFFRYATLILGSAVIINGFFLR
jgi:hypothetical protein